MLCLAMSFMAGIVFSWYAGVGMQLLLLFISVSMLALLSGFMNILPRCFFGLGAFCFLFSCGAYVECMQSKEKAPQWSSEKLAYRATLSEVPLFRGTSVKVLAHVEAVDTLLPSGVRKEGMAYLYFSRGIASDTLAVGDIISFRSEMNPIRNAGNPAEFDFEHHCYVKGISGTLFLHEGSWQKIGECNKTLQMNALSLRERVVGIYSSSGISDDGRSLLSALTIGEKRDFSQELKESYSNAGASHVLALSGLHLGILYMLLLFAMPFNGQNRYLIFSRELTVLLLLWGFAFVAGLSPSVVRAAILFSIMSLGRCLRRDSSSLNSLAFAALLMLLFEPHLLFDVSFQLSFSAVLSILLFAPPVQRALNIEKHGVVYGYVANLLILSFAAQLGTLPFVWYYFGVFPIYFLLTNIFVVPMAFVVMLLAVVVWLLSFAPVVQEPVLWLLGYIAEVMNAVVSALSELPGASYQLPHTDVGVAVALGAILILVMVAANVGKKRLLIFAILTLVMFVAVFNCFPADNEESSYLLIYNNRKNPLVHAVAECGANYLVSTVPEADAEYEYVSSPYMKREGLPAPFWASGSYSDSLISVNNGLLSFADLNVMMLDHGNWEDNEYAEPVDVLLLCRGFLGKIDRVLECYPASCLVLDASLYSRSRERILRECRKAGIEPVDVSESGAVKLLASGDSFAVYPMRDK